MYPRVIGTRTGDAVVEGQVGAGGHVRRCDHTGQIEGRGVAVVARAVVPVRVRPENGPVC